MRSSAIFSVVSFLAHQAAAQAESGDVLGHGSYIASRIRRKADVNLNSGDYLKRHVEALVNRQQMASPTESGMAMPTSTGPVSFNPMMNDTEAACSQALMGAKATDDSGMAACFNVNFFDNSTGYYQANVLLYQLSAPTGQWASIKPGGIELNMYFEGATAKMQPMTAMKKRDEESASTTDAAATPIRRTLSARSGGPVMIESHTFLGSISAPFNTQLTNTTAMRQALTPSIMINAMTTQGANATANVTAPANAAFVNGFFSEAFISEKQAEAQAAANPPPFVLPGTTLGIDKGLYPVGLVVTSVWTIFFVLFVGVGTWDRIQWRKAYRSKKPNASGK